MDAKQIEDRIRRLEELERGFGAESARMKLENPWPFPNVLEYLEALREVQAALLKARAALVTALDKKGKRR